MICSTGGNEMDDLRATDDISRNDGIQSETSGRIAAAEKVIRVTAATVVFGIPLLIGTVALIGCGIHSACKRLRK